MNCFNHQYIAAVGICKHCNKALCPECANDLGHGLACKNKHEEQVENIKFIIDRSTRIYKASPKNSWIMPAFYLFMGVVFAGFGLYRNGPKSLPFILGLGFIIFSVIILLRVRAIHRKQ